EIGHSIPPSGCDSLNQIPEIAECLAHESLAAFGVQRLPGVEDGRRRALLSGRQGDRATRCELATAGPVETKGEARIDHGGAGERGRLSDRRPGQSKLTRDQLRGDGGPLTRGPRLAPERASTDRCCGGNCRGV